MEEKEGIRGGGEVGLFKDRLNKTVGSYISDKTDAQNFTIEILNEVRNFISRIRLREIMLNFSL